MKKILALLVSCIFVFGSLALVCSADFVDIPVDGNITVEGDFTAEVTFQRGETNQVFDSIVAYRDGATWLMFWVITDQGNPARVDFAVEKVVNDSNLGRLIAEEYEATGKNCFVSVDDGWDASTDTAFTLNVAVKSGIATVTLTGNTTGETGQLTFDLSKPATSERPEETTVLTGGQVHLQAGANGGIASDFRVEIPAASTTETTSTSTTGSTTATTRPAYTDDENTFVKGDFKATATVTRAADGMVTAGMVFYRDDTTNSQYAFYVRSDSDPARVDFYGEKIIDDQWVGFLIAEEYEATGKDCFVSVDDGWDATADNVFTLEVDVQDGMAYVKLTGETTGQFGMLTYDLSKPGTAERDGRSWDEGYVYTDMRTGDAGNLEVEYEPVSQSTTEPTSAPTSEPTTEPTSAPTTEPTTEPTSEPTGSPDTGDVSGTAAMVMLFVASLLGAGAAAMSLRKKQSVQ